MTRRWARLTCPALATRHASPWWRKMSATSNFSLGTFGDLCRRRLRDVQGLKGTLYLSDRIDRDPSISSGGVDMPVSEQVLDDADVHPLLQQVCGEAVPQRVDGDCLIQASSLSGKTTGALQGAHRDRTSRIGAWE